MPTYSFVTVDVFTDHRFGGNPLAVFPDAQGLSDAEMQALAAEFNLSETAFVLPPDDPAHTARVRIFTPAAELPFAGHPNVGTGYVLAQAGRDRQGTLLFEEIAGLVHVTISRDAAGAVLRTTIAAPQPLTIGAEIPVGVVAACAGLDPQDIQTDHSPVLASVGTPFAFAEVSPEALARAAPHDAAFRRAARDEPNLADMAGLHLFAWDGARLRARMFAPLQGIQEDPATGSANTALVALLLSRRGSDALQVDVIQGVEMGRPSLLHLAASRGPDGIRATVAGQCVPVLRGEASV